MNKLLTAGLVAAVAMTSANASQCGNGGFYVQGNLGISVTKMKYKNDLVDQEGVMNFRELPKMMRFKVKNGDGGYCDGYTNLYNYKDLINNDAKVDLTTSTLKKRKGMFLLELGLGYDLRINDVMVGMDVNFGKNFGNVKKTTKAPALMNYIKAEDLSHQLVNSITNAETVENIPNTKTAGTRYIQSQETEINENLDTNNYVKSSDIDMGRTYDPESELELKMKNKYFISFMPRVGYLVAPKFEIYLTAGVKIRSDKYTGIYKAYDTKLEGKKSVTKCIPSVGGGFRYEFDTGMFANLSVIYNFRSKKTISDFKATKDTKHTFHASSTDVKVGFGYRF